MGARINAAVGFSIALLAMAGTAGAAQGAGLNHVGRSPSPPLCEGEEAQIFEVAALESLGSSPPHKVATLCTHLLCLA